MDIELESISYKIFFSVNGNELLLKLKSSNSNRVYLNQFSLDNLQLMSNYFKQFDSLNKCKNKLENFIKKKNIK
jgi:hypothetical protein